MAQAAPNALVIGTWTAVAPLEYMQHVEHRRDDLTLVQAWVFGWIGPNDLVRYALTHDRVVYVDALDGIDTDGVTVGRAGAWYRLDATRAPAGAGTDIGTSAATDAQQGGR